MNEPRGRQRGSATGRGRAAASEASGLSGREREAQRDITNDDRAKAVTSARFIALSQLGMTIGDLAHYDLGLVRESRLLVPVDVQALVVRDGDEPMVRLPFRDGTDVAPPPDDPGAKRPPGVHLLWTTPAAFGRGKVVDDPTAPGDATRRLLQLPPLPDRWIVLRLAVAVGVSDPLVTGWVLEADTASITPLADWPADRTRTQKVGVDVDPEQLTVHIGGPTWTQCYDASLGRLSLHDPLDDLEALAPNGLVGDALTYVVAGWWNDVRHDPLDGVGSIYGYHTRLEQLGWDDPDHPAPEGVLLTEQRTTRNVATTLGLARASRFEQPPGAAVNDGRTFVTNASSGFLRDGLQVADVPDAPTRTTLLHGRIHGVPLRSDGRPDDRPSSDQVRLALGPTTPSVSAVLASGAITTGGDAARQRDAERLLTAFSSGLLSRIDQADTWPDIEQYEHAQGFGTQSGGVEATDRFVDAPPSGNDPGSGSRPGRRTKFQNEVVTLAANILYSPTKAVALGFAGVGGNPAPPAAGGRAGAIERAQVAKGTASAVTAPSTVAAAAKALLAREVDRPAPPFATVVSPVLAVVGAGRRVLAAERDEADGTLRVRTSDQHVRGLAGVYTSDELLRSIGTGAVPDEVLQVARESMAEDPYLTSWRSQRVADKGLKSPLIDARLKSEAAVNYAFYAGDDARMSKYVNVDVGSSATRQTVMEALAKHSLVEGVLSHPEGVTMWGQPWRPLFCEWSVDLDLAAAAELGEWVLGEVDLDRATALTPESSVTFTGRSPLVTGAAKTLATSVDRWLADERARAKNSHGLASPQVEAAMTALRDHLNHLDVLSVTLDGIRETLLGLAYDRGVVRAAGDEGPDGAGRALADALPRLVTAGRLRLTHARLVDSFGRTLDLPVESSVVAARNADADPDPGPGAVMQLRPRLSAPARFHLRLVDPLAVTGTAATAFVDQGDPASQVNPVAGFLLPDHIDEALEMFAVDGTPLGQVSHDPFSDAVYWEGAPGRTDIGPAAGPLDDVDPGHRRLGWIANALATVDASERQARPDRPETESALSALLRAIDTTLWTVDPFGSLGSEHIAGLVGRPIAVVTAHLTLDVDDDLDELVYSAGTSREARAAAYAELAATPFSVRLGSAARQDDGLLGYFVDDDYTRVFTIDEVITTLARDAGRCRGDLGAPVAPVVKPIDHPFVVPGGTITIRQGQTVRLTLLMHPGGKVHLTSGIVPRSAIALFRDWVQPGLSVMAPSVRVGPLLIDADKVRLPKVASFPADQLFTRRDTPGSWKDDPILAATQSAYLPDEASAVQEGWIRIAPTQPDGGAKGTGA